LARWDRLATLCPLRDEPVLAIVAGDAAASQNGAEREEQQEIDKQKHDTLPEKQRTAGEKHLLLNAVPTRQLRCVLLRQEV
jgi:hypothetical protein